MNRATTSEILPPEEKSHATPFAEGDDCPGRRPAWLADASIAMAIESAAPPRTPRATSRDSPVIGPIDPDARSSTVRHCRSGWWSSRSPPVAGAGRTPESHRTCFVHLWSFALRRMLIGPLLTPRQLFLVKFYQLFDGKSRAGAHVEWRSLRRA
jgi:hypothetical protein